MLLLYVYTSHIHTHSYEEIYISSVYIHMYVCIYIAYLLHIPHKFTFLSKKFHSIRCSDDVAHANVVVAALKRKYQK